MTFKSNPNNTPTPQPSPGTRVHPLPAVKALQSAAKLICENPVSPLPDLSRIIVLVPQARLIRSTRDAIQKHAEHLGFPAILLPKILTLPGLLEELAPETGASVVGEEQRQLMLMDAIRRHPRLYGKGSPWSLAENLLQLFDQLTLHHISLPNSVDELITMLASAYSLTKENPGLLSEARMVHTLSQAWHEQLSAENKLDRASFYLQQLSTSITAIPEKHTIYMMGYHSWLPAEYEWMESIASRVPFFLLTADTPENAQIDSTSYLAFLHACYAPHHTPLKARTNALTKQYKHSPLHNRIYIQSLPDLEHEVLAISIRVQTAIHAGKRNIAVVTEDRRLARRLRAVLERDKIELHDSTGWALSTTRAATIVENWLECIENDFPHLALLDLLKSPALTAQDDLPQLKAVYRLEQDIVLRRNIAGGLQRYLRALDHPSCGLDPDSQATIKVLLQKLENSAKQLSRFVHQKTTITALVDALLDSLEQLKVADFLSQDPAGELILNLLTRMRCANEQHSIKLNWLEFRTWFARLLEKNYFSPPALQKHRIQLLNLEQSELQQFEMLIIAGADEHHLPNISFESPFFNDAVRAALQLLGQTQKLKNQYDLFYALLQNSDSVLITWQHEQAGEPVAPSPWVELLLHFHQQAFNHSLNDPALLESVREALSESTSTTPEVPVLPNQMPTPAISTDMIPTEISVSGHQRLINCPYLFFTNDILQLKPFDEIRPTLEKSDYGSRVHKCLEAFHAGAKNLPGPFKEVTNQNNRDTAIALLKSISVKVFTRDIEDNFQHRSWLKRWLVFIPQYIDWQIEREATWQITAAEQQHSTQLDADITLHGRVDRIEQANKKTAVIDYKTGGIPHIESIFNGEDVQLSSYALILDHVYEVSYLGLDGNRGIDARAKVEGEALESLSIAIKNRLEYTLAQIKSGAALPALADESVCKYCNSAGICRRRLWNNG